MALLGDVVCIRVPEGDVQRKLHPSVADRRLSVSVFCVTFYSFDQISKNQYAGQETNIDATWMTVFKSYFYL